MPNSLEEIAKALDQKFPCPTHARGSVTEWKSNRLCGLRSKKNVPIFQCSQIAGPVSIEPYQSGQAEGCCKRCETFWQVGELNRAKIGVKNPAPLNVTLRACSCGRRYEGTPDYKGCGVTKCINPARR